MKVAVLTGATGGLGKVFAKELLKEDIDQIWAIARNEDKLNELRDTLGEKIAPIKCDLSNENEVRKLKELFDEIKPEVKFLINNAGMAKMGKAVDFSEDELSQTIEINCKTPTLLCSYSIPYMSNGSKILNISSASSFQPNPYIALYSATKVYLRSYTRSLNYELKDKGITCTAVCPGWIDTEMIQKEYNGKPVKFPGLVSAEKVVVKALNDAKKGKDMSVCTFFVKYEHFISKILPQKWIMNIWGKGVKKYVED